MRPIEEMQKDLRVVSIVEGTHVTGPIKPLLTLAGQMRTQAVNGCRAKWSLITTARARSSSAMTRNALGDAMHQSGFEMDVLLERRVGDWRVVRQLAQRVKESNPHIVETHDVKCHFLLSQALLWGGLKRTFSWIAYHHGYTRTSAKVRMYQQLDRWTLSRANHVVTLCEPFVEQLVGKGVSRAKITVLTNPSPVAEPPSVAELAHLREKFHIRDDERLFLSVGRLSAEKGHSDLVRAFALLVKSRPDARLRLLLAGDGPERAALERQVEEAGISVDFIGHQAPIWPYYFLADVFVLPSHTEGSPLVLLEAMAAGRCIVATRVGGVPELVSHERNALLVAPHDPAALAREMGRALTDDDLASTIREGAIAEANRHTPEYYAERVFAIYKKVRSQ